MSNLKLSSYIKRLIREVLDESPQLGWDLNWQQLSQISSLIGTQANKPDTKVDIVDDYIWLSGPIFGDYRNFWYVLFKKSDEKLHCCFACLLEQIQSINGIVTYQPKFSFKLANFPEKATAKTYIQMMQSKKCNIASDSKQSDAGARIWKEMLLNPELKDKIFIWDSKQQKIINTINPDDIWGHDDKFKDVLIVITMV